MILAIHEYNRAEPTLLLFRQGMAAVTDCGSDVKIEMTNGKTIYIRTHGGSSEASKYIVNSIATAEEGETVGVKVMFNVDVDYIRKI